VDSALCEPAGASEEIKVSVSQGGSLEEVHCSFSQGPPNETGRDLRGVRDVVNLIKVKPRLSALKVQGHERGSACGAAPRWTRVTSRSDLEGDPGDPARHGPVVGHREEA